MNCGRASILKFFDIVLITELFCECLNIPQVSTQDARQKMPSYSIHCGFERNYKVSEEICFPFCVTAVKEL